MMRPRALTSISMVLAGAVFFPAATLPAQNSPSATAPAHRATLNTYCIRCHSGPTPSAGLHLDALDTANFETNGDTWEKLARKLRHREMPPAGMPRPDAATYDASVKYIETGRDPTMPVSYQTYTIPHGLIQLDRVSEAAPAGSRGGTVVRHLFPVDGEYEISVALQRSRDDEYLGLQRERKLDLRLDDQRLKLFTIAASRKKVVLGGGTPPDAHLKVRVPVKAGTRELAATFLKDTLIKEGIIERVRDDVVQTYFEGVGSITVAGPFNVQGSGNTATRNRIFICHPSGAAEEQACANKILSNLAHRAYRRPAA